MAAKAKDFRNQLVKSTGLTDAAINAAWPEWWSETADASPSAQAELRFSIARKLGLDPRSLLDNQEPSFFWDDSAKFKNFRGDAKNEQPAIAAFGTSVGRMLVNGTPELAGIGQLSAKQIRASILRNERVPFVRLSDLLATCWGIGIPVIHLKVYPLAAKRMCAMAIRSGDRHAILLAKDANYPAMSAFHLAHEIGHIMLGHVTENSALIDMEEPGTAHDAQADHEEEEADRFALELLTGDADFKIAKEGPGHNAKELAHEARRLSIEYAIEPGTIALCYAYATQEWAVAQAAMQEIYDQDIPAWRVTNQIASNQLNWSELSDENVSFLQAVMGGIGA
ncbi:ImmA/IrrE family metallo-endopeptidase [uncultured Oxalicibacterium sp.]|uniref:ImmA/IrrE family metallo-endopeptidase n=1 Tax=uncultured Oxalicibacterium sp. TaxID=1168540 RepID=UPI0025D06FBC|nr:ImmA/IrrE family metallo-endopeptidase [uncultured Oxalicibacterium sp.]